MNNNNLKEDQITGFKREIDKASKKNQKVFFNWFNESGGDVDSNFLKGMCDFFTFILFPTMKFIKNPKEKTALEIGYGGGRLLAASAEVFNNVIGVDIHNNRSLVETELKKRNIKNFKLIQNDGQTIPLKSQTIDFIYSFIVLQHVEKIEILKQYVKESYRLLKPEGIAILYFGRLSQFSKNRKSRFIYWLDRFFDKLWIRGYREINRNVNETNLVVTLSCAKNIANKIGFTIIGSGVSREGGDIERYRGQHYLVLAKNI